MIKILGKGNEGCVALGLHRQSGQLRALKLLEGCRSGEFSNEVMALKRLHHPALPEIDDVLHTEKGIILVMTYARGENLQTYIRTHGAMKESDLLKLGILMSGALRYLHSSRPPMLHLDIKPSNIILCPDGKLVLVDFGSSFIKRDRVRLRQSGTAGYAPAEQYDLKIVPDGRADIYALGAVLFFAWTGTEPGEKPDFSLIRQCPAAPVIQKCLERDRRNRYRNAKLMERDLQRIYRKKSREKGRMRFYPAFLMVLFSGVLAFRALQGNLAETKEQEWNYGKILEEAYCLPADEAGALYLRAFFLEPQTPDAYFNLVGQIDSDGVVTREDDLMLRSLIHEIPPGGTATYEEMFAQNKGPYARFCFLLGLAYRYDYETQEGKTIGAGWLKKASDAIAAGKLHPEWEDLLNVYSCFAAGKGNPVGSLPGGGSYVLQNWELQRSVIIEEKESILDIGRRIELYQEIISWLLENLALLRQGRIDDAEIKSMAEIQISRIEEISAYLLPESEDAKKADDTLAAAEGLLRMLK